MKPEIIEHRLAVKNGILAQLIELAGPGVYTLDGAYIHAPNRVTLEFEWLRTNFTYDNSVTLDCITVDFGYSSGWKKRTFKRKNGKVNVAGIHKAVGEYAEFCAARAKRLADAATEKKEQLAALALREQQLRDRLTNAEFTVTSCSQNGNNSDELILSVNHPALKQGLAFRATSTGVTVQLTITNSFDNTVWMARKVRDLLLALENLPAVE